MSLPKLLLLRILAKYQLQNTVRFLFFFLSNHTEASTTYLTDVFGFATAYPRIHNFTVMTLLFVSFRSRLVK